METIEQDAGLVSYRIKPNLPRIGKQYGKLIPAIRKAIDASDAAVLASTASSGEVIQLNVGDQTIELAPEDLLIESTSAAGYACAEEQGFMVGLDLTITPELEREGLARELVRTVQEARKQSGLEISDRIQLHVSGSAPVQAVLEEFRGFVMNETLAVTWADDPQPLAHQDRGSLGDDEWVIAFSVAADEQES